MIKGFFFDLDGTIIDTHKANYEAYKKALAEFDVDITFNDFKKTIGRQFKDFAKDIAPGLKTIDYSIVAKRKSIYYKELLHLSRPNTALINFLIAMTKHHQIVLVTTAKIENTKSVLSHYKIEPYFDYIIAAEDTRHAKPAPDAYKLALRKTGLAPNEAIAFEDSESGKKSAEAAGLAVVMIKDFVL